MVQLSATRCSCIANLWVSLVSFVAITLCVASQRVFTRVYPKVSRVATWGKNCKWYSSLQLGAVVSLFCESVCHHNTLCCFSSVYCCKRIFLYGLNPESFGYTLVHFLFNSVFTVVVVPRNDGTWGLSAGKTLASHVGLADPPYLWPSLKYYVCEE
jgi:hypothetical protein